MCRQQLPMRRLAALLGLASLLLLRADAKLVHPTIPPRGMNSFDIQFARRYPNATVPVWNETEFRRLANTLYIFVLVCRCLT